MNLPQRHAMTPIGQLKKHPQNPRRGDVAAIKSSIRRNGFYGEVIAQEGTGYILAGNHRFEAAVQSGATSVPVCWVECDERTALKILLADNRTGDLASYNDELLVGVLAELDKTPEALDGTGYTNQDYSALLASLDAGREPEQQVTPGGVGQKIKVSIGEYQGFATPESYARLVATVHSREDAEALFRKLLGMSCASPI